jgi:hypothetical protein
VSDWTPSDTDAPDPGPPDTGRTLTIISIHTNSADRKTRTPNRLN